MAHKFKDGDRVYMRLDRRNERPVSVGHRGRVIHGNLSNGWVYSNIGIMRDVGVQFDGDDVMTAVYEEDIRHVGAGHSAAMALPDLEFMTNRVLQTANIANEFNIPKPREFTTTAPKGGSLMSKLTLLAKKAFDADTRTLIKAGVLNDDLSVRDSQFILQFLVGKHKADLAAAAQEQLDDEKVEK